MDGLIFKNWRYLIVFDFILKKSIDRFVGFCDQSVIWGMSVCVIPSETTNDHITLTFSNHRSPPSGAGDGRCLCVHRRCLSWYIWRSSSIYLSVYLSIYLLLMLDKIHSKKKEIEKIKIFDDIDLHWKKNHRFFGISDQ